jgi:hypothetical protein
MMQEGQNDLPQQTVAMVDTKTNENDRPAKRYIFLVSLLILKA